MTQEEKQLLLKDLCTRLPYGVYCSCIHEPFATLSRIDVEDQTVYYQSCDEWESIEYCKPYLRPMSSMTEEEIKTYHSYCECNDGDFNGEILYFDTIESFDYLTSIHIDYRGLIPMGLALEAPVDMYKTK